MSTLTLTPVAAEPGTKVKLSGKGYPARSQVLISFGPTIVASVKSDSAGKIAGTFVVPNGAKVGKVIVRTAVASSGAGALTVVAPGPSSGDSFRYR